MNISTLDLTIFNITIDNFILTIIIVVALLIIAGVILMIRNVRPILGMLLIIFAIAMIIGVSYDANGIRRSFTKFWEQVATGEVQEESQDNESDD